MATLDVPADGWTFETLPDVGDLRCELVDGALIVTPPGRPRHSAVATRLARLLADAAPEELEVLVEAGLFLDDRNYRVPDVLVCRRSALDEDRLRPRDVLLVVEVVSSTSLTQDRVEKPAVYAAAGIPSFWRLEPEQGRLDVCVLRGLVYAEERHTRTVTVAEPFPAVIDLATLLG